MYEHLATTADQFWLAKRDDKTVGFARSIVRGSLRLLTEFFVLPGQQSSGLGRELLARAFPAAGAERRWLLATSDLRAQALYLKHGLYPNFAAYYFWRQPRVSAAMATDLDIEPVEPSPETILAMGDIDSQLLDHRRDVDHRWLMSGRQAYLYRRGREPVGYGYVGRRSGPFALLDDADFPAALAHAESETAQLGRTHFGLEVPMVNHSAVAYLMDNGFQIDSFMAQFMSDGPTGRFSNYIITSPPFIL
jgi:ribosomal protein S18 acetylase RimI-like enzyme